MSGTIGLVDLYGRASAVSGASDPLGIRNANGASVAPITSTASGGGSANDPGPAISWVGLVAALVLLRVAIYAAEEA